MRKRNLSIFIMLLVIISGLGFRWYFEPKIQDELDYYQNKGYKVKERNWSEYKGQFATDQLWLIQMEAIELRDKVKEINSTLGFCTIFFDQKEKVIWAHIIVSYGQKVAAYWVKY